MRKQLLNSFKCAIVQDPALLEELKSYKTWFDRYGETASLNEIADKLDEAQTRVSKHFYFTRQVLFTLGTFVGLIT